MPIHMESLNLLWIHERMFRLNLQLLMIFCLHFWLQMETNIYLLGFCVQLLEKEMQSALETAGCFIAGPTATLAPADKELYKRRDVTATVDSIPLCVGQFLSIYVLLIRIVR